MSKKDFPTRSVFVPLTRACVLALILGPLSAQAAITVTGTFMFRDNRGINDVGITSGDRLQFGGNIQGGSAGYSISATYPPSGFTDPAVVCGPLAVNPNFCSGTTPYNASRTASPWDLTFSKAGDSVTLAGPSLAGTGFKVPFPTSVTISSSSGQLTPTMSWALPPSYVPNGFRVQVFDKKDILPNGSANIIYNDDVPVNATSFVVPSGILKTDGNYALNLQVVETRGDIPFTNAQTQILTRSNSFFSFSPVSAGTPDIHLPQVGSDPNPNDNLGAPYQFTVDSVGANSVTFIDPDVAIGYDYAIGAGNPNFASVILPNVGDGQFELHYVQGGNPVIKPVGAGDQFFFQAGGVAAFGVRGIETSAGLDPTDATAFVTGLTFVSAGAFTGTMTPITEFVPAPIPEPETYALMLAGLAVIGFAARKRMRT